MDTTNSEIARSPWTIVDLKQTPKKYRHGIEDVVSILTTPVEVGPRKSQRVQL